jgi:nitroreductase
MGRIQIGTPAPSGRGFRNLLLAARASGLGAVPTTYALRFRDELHEVLGLPDDVAAQAIIPVGFPTGNFGPVTRRPIHEITTFDRWDGPHPAVPDLP